jgi:SAM-dependent methyltransferase
MKPERTSEKIRSYWNDSAAEKGIDPRATTPDYWLRELEIFKIGEALEKINNKKNILDIGCGNGFSTVRLSRKFTKSNFVGGDYAEKMIDKAKLLAKKLRANSARVSFEAMDVMSLGGVKNKFDVVISDRCVINLPNVGWQKKAVREIAQALRRGGHYIMAENFAEGYDNINKLRGSLGLGPIPLRWHNCYLNEDFLRNVVFRNFKLIRKENFSSLYYLLTRAVYSKICQLEKREPDYDNKIYEVAAELTKFVSVGDWGPLDLLILKKK